LHIFHISLHILVPALVAALFYRKTWLKSFALLMLGMIVDVDHLLATPVYDPARCSMGFHPLHTWPAVLVYAALTLWPKSRTFGIGLLLHMLLDTSDCLLINS
jgi:hypothetical protein